MRHGTFQSRHPSQCNKDTNIFIIKVFPSFKCVPVTKMKINKISEEIILD